MEKGNRNRRRGREIGVCMLIPVGKSTNRKEDAKCSQWEGRIVKQIWRRRVQMFNKPGRKPGLAARVFGAKAET